MTRGYRNNNPGNIRKTSSVWIGQVLPGDDQDFCTFSSIAYGYRAMFVLLQNYIDKGFDTVEKIINRWAPSSENNSQAYILHVVQLSGIPAGQVIAYSDGETIKKLVAAISYHENGTSPNFTDIEKGYELTGQIQTVTTIGISTVAVLFVCAISFIVYNHYKIK